MNHLRANAFLANRGDRLGCYVFGSCPPPPPGGQVRTAPAATPPATGAAVPSTQGSAAAEARSAHNREVAGSTPVPATNPVAKASEDNGRIDAATGSPTAGEASRGSDAADRQRPALPGFTGDDDGRDVEAFGGAASVITLTSCAGGVGSAARETAPADHPKPTAPAGAVTLSEASAFILSLVAAHEGRAPGDILAELIAAAADAIGIHSLIMRDAGEVDLAGVPNFALSAANRFRGGGP